MNLCKGIKHYKEHTTSRETIHHANNIPRYRKIKFLLYDQLAPNFDLVLMCRCTWTIYNHEAVDKMTSIIKLYKEDYGFGKVCIEVSYKNDLGTWDKEKFYDHQLGKIEEFVFDNLF